MDTNVEVKFKLHPHHWRKMWQAQKNLMAFAKGGRRKNRFRRCRYWSRAFPKQLALAMHYNPDAFWE